MGCPMCLRILFLLIVLATIGGTNHGSLLVLEPAVDSQSLKLREHPVSGTPQESLIIHLSERIKQAALQLEDPKADPDSVASDSNGLSSDRYPISVPRILKRAVSEPGETRVSISGHSTSCEQAYSDIWKRFKEVAKQIDRLVEEKQLKLAFQLTQKNCATLRSDLTQLAYRYPKLSALVDELSSTDRCIGVEKRPSEVASLLSKGAEEQASRRVHGRQYDSDTGSSSPPPPPRKSRKLSKVKSGGNASIKQAVESSQQPLEGSSRLHLHQEMRPHHHGQEQGGHREGPPTVGDNRKTSSTQSAPARLSRRGLKSRAT